MRHTGVPRRLANPSTRDQQALCVEIKLNGGELLVWHQITINPAPAPVPLDFVVPPQSFKATVFLDVISGDTTTTNPQCAKRAGNDHPVIENRRNGR
jgi:hypothetical protein